MGRKCMNKYDYWLFGISIVGMFLKAGNIVDMSTTSKKLFKKKGNKQLNVV